MASRPVATGGEWQVVEIDGYVHWDAEGIALGVLAFGGEVGFDKASLTVTGELPENVADAPRPLTARGLESVRAFGRLFGLVRHFHPSDEAAAADWNQLAREAILAVEQAPAPEALAGALRSVFRPVAPTADAPATVGYGRMSWQ